MNEVDKVTEEAINNGGVLFLMYFDAHGPTQDAIRNRLTQMFAKISKENGVVYGVGTIETPIEDEYEGKKVYSTSGEIKVLAKDLLTMTRLALAYGPVFIEVLKPEKRVVGFEELQDVMNEVAQTTYSLSQYIVQNTLKGDALKSFTRNIKYREKLGERLRKGEHHADKEKND